MAKRKLSLEKTAVRYMSLKAEQKKIEGELGSLKATLETALRESEDGTREFVGWRFSLVEFEKESFSLSKAREKITEKVLKPFITKAFVTQIRYSWQGVNLEAEDKAA